MTSPVVEGLRDAFPVVLAYLPIAMTFGVLAANHGLSVGMAVMISAIIYGGASQFILVALYVSGVGAIPMTLTVLLVNLRHLLYGTTLGPALRGWSEGTKWVAAFGLTDEVFAVSASRIETPPSPPYQLALSLACYASWVLGSGIGALIGSSIPAEIAAVLTFALPALFLSLLLSRYRSTAHLVAAMTGGAVAVVVGSRGSASVAIVAGAVIGATTGMVLPELWRRKRASTIP